MQLSVPSFGKHARIRDTDEYGSFEAAVATSVKKRQAYKRALFILGSSVRLIYRPEPKRCLFEVHDCHDDSRHVRFGRAQKHKAVDVYCQIHAFTNAPAEDTLKACRVYEICFLLHLHDDSKVAFIHFPHLLGTGAQNAAQPKERAYCRTVPESVIRGLKFGLVFMGHHHQD
jgi:hypothetical protein